MIRRFLCLGVVLMMLCISACSDTKSTTGGGGATVPDPGGMAKPKVGGIKGG
jgi:hypothetical protein